MSANKFYITTPIYYVNDRPHVGHAYTTIVADVLARYHRLQGKEVVFLTGTDENSQKTVDAALKSGEDLKTYTDRLAAIWKSVWKELNITNTDFIRTTEERHKETVREIWRRIWEKGDIYKGKYEGLYCRGHEAFLKESELVNGLCPDHKTEPEHLVEENYFFKLSKYQDRLLKFYDSNLSFVVPVNRFNEVKSFVSQGLEDISISRETQKWGIPVPNDPEHVVYVWFDALINYVSAVGIKDWQDHPADVHTVGKDIVRFHAVIWPAMLLAADLELPRQIAANGFFTVNGEKISKSLGNAIDPVELAKKYGNDALRYFLLREIPYGEDGDFSYAKLQARYNAELANGLGNLVQRVATLIETGLEGKPIFRTDRVDSEVLKKLDSFEIDDSIEDFKLHNALVKVWDLITLANSYINERRPWDEVKNNPEGFLKTMTSVVAVIHRVNWFLHAFLPETVGKIKNIFSLPSFNNIPDKEKITVKKGEPLFLRLD